MELDFFQQVYQVVQDIPEGKVTTYGAIANYLNRPRASRLVGWAMNASHGLEDPIPAHRVVNRLGQLTGAVHFKTPTAMQEALEQEGLIIKNGQIQNFELHFWKPELEF